MADATIEGAAGREYRLEVLLAVDGSRWVPCMADPGVTWSAAAAKRELDLVGANVPEYQYRVAARPLLDYAPLTGPELDAFVTAESQEADPWSTTAPAFEENGRVAP